MISPTNREAGVLRAVVGFFVVIALTVVAVPWFVLGKVVPPDQIGVRRNYFTVPGVLEGGFSAKGLAPGLHWQIPFLSKVELIPRGLQYISFSEKSEDGEKAFPQLLVQTTDGSKVKNDVTLIFRFFETEGSSELSVRDDQSLKEESGLEAAPKSTRKLFSHGGPRQLIERYTANPVTITEKFAQRAENELRQALSNLSTSDYYNPRLREEAALSAHDRIAKSVAGDGLELWGALVRRYSYAEQKIDDQIFAKNLQDQTERLNAAASRLAAAKAETERQRALWDAKIGNLEAEGEAKVKVVESEAKLYESQRKAEGDLLVASARAEVDSERAKVLSQIAGSDVYVARELAPLLETLKGGVVSDLDPFDIEAWSKKLLGGAQ
jgi:hypothetical protein